jgi:pyruvate/2-oxoglutarate dehydrogenase complex dihydrolipoamide acyltransferase (E2) component
MHRDPGPGRSSADPARRPSATGRRAVSSRSFAILTFACDHRAVYGAEGAAFLARLQALLESPEVLVL